MMDEVQGNDPKAVDEVVPDVRAIESPLEGLEITNVCPKASVRFNLDNNSVLTVPKGSHGKRQKRRERAAAIFYSECTMNGISAVDAQAAATEAQQKYEKWWTQKSWNVKLGKRRNWAESEAVTPSCKRVTNSVVSDAIRDEDTIAVKDFFNRLEGVKEGVVSELKRTGGDTESSFKFNQCVDILSSFYLEHGNDSRWHSAKSPDHLDGSWLTLSKPTFSDCQGVNNDGEYVYSLGRMSFDMFRPTHLRCSVQGIFNRIAPFEDRDRYSRPKTMPFSLQRASASKSLSIRVYDIIVAFTVHPDEDDEEESNKPPIRGYLTNCGYCTPDPETPNRLTIWFSGGVLKAQDGTSTDDWRSLFSEDRLPKRDLGEMARVIAARILLGAKLPERMDENGAMKYYMNRPIGGHGSVYIDTLYSDETLRILKGHMGSMFVFKRDDRLNVSDASM